MILDYDELDDLRSTRFGKILLFGEHAAVYKKPAIGLPVSKSLTLSVSQNANDHSEEISQALNQSLEKLSTIVPEHGLVSEFIDLKTELPLSSGYGSSASFSTCLVELALKKKRMNSALMLWPFSHELEKVFHQTPSGIDTGIICHEGLSLFTFEKENALPTRHTIRSKDLYIVHMATVRQGSTKTLVGEIKTKMTMMPALIEPMLNILGEASLSFAHEVHGAASFALVKNLVQDSQKILTKLGVVSEEHAALAQYAHNLGTVGKMSGAGGGGVFYVFAQDVDEAHHLESKLNQFIKDKGINKLADAEVLLLGTSKS